MREAFLRFITATVDHESGRRRGIFQAVGDLIAAGELPAHDLEALNELRSWFATNLEKPDRFARSRKSGAASRAIHWYRSSATEHIARMRRLCQILNEHDIDTMTLSTFRPGYVVYEDEHQVAAEPFADTET